MKVTPLRSNPQVIDEITDGIHDRREVDSTHIERMDEHNYWVRLGDHEFYFRSAAKRGRGIELVPYEKGMT